MSSEIQVLASYLQVSQKKVVHSQTRCHDCVHPPHWEVQSRKVSKPASRFIVNEDVGILCAYGMAHVLADTYAQAE